MNQEIKERTSLSPQKPRLSSYLVVDAILCSLHYVNRVLIDLLVRGGTYIHGDVKIQICQEVKPIWFVESMKYAHTESARNHAQPTPDT